jgi:hypothetical protein
MGTALRGGRWLRLGESGSSQGLSPVAPQCA